MDGAWATNATSSNNSALPTALIELSPRRIVWGESIPKFIIVNEEGVVEALKFGQPGMLPFRKAVKKALKH